MHDLVLRGGTIVDGTGATARRATSPSTAIASPRSAARPARAAREIDAAGLLVTPGFVDIHTHYDGQVTWDPLPHARRAGTASPRVVMGNCGVGFAPVRPGRHEWLIGLMEGVEDIPGTALAEGIQLGAGRPSPSTSTRSSACRARSTSARRCRTAPCAPT